MKYILSEPTAHIMFEPHEQFDVYATQTPNWIIRIDRLVLKREWGKNKSIRLEMYGSRVLKSTGEVSRTRSKRELRSVNENPQRLDGVIASEFPLALRTTVKGAITRYAAELDRAVGEIDLSTEGATT